MQKPYDLVVVDLDDVLNQFTAWSARNVWGYTDDNPDKSHLDWYDPACGYNIHSAINKAVPGAWLDRDEFWAAFKAEHFQHIPPDQHLDSVLFTARILAGWEEDNVVLATAISMKHQGIIDAKMDWIKKHLPEWIHNNVSFTTCKWTLGAPNRLLIDDNQDNCDKFKARGGDYISPSKPWNNAYEHGIDLGNQLFDLAVERGLL